MSATSAATSRRSVTASRPAVDRRRSERAATRWPGTAARAAPPGGPTEPGREARPRPRTPRRGKRARTSPRGGRQRRARSRRRRRGDSWPAPVARRGVRGVRAHGGRDAGLPGRDEGCSCSPVHSRLPAPADRRGASVSSPGTTRVPGGSDTRVFQDGVQPPCRRDADLRYADRAVVLGPLATYAEPHTYDLCREHAERMTAPRGWEVVRVGGEYSEPALAPDDLLALADAVREAGRPRAQRPRVPRARATPATPGARRAARPALRRTPGPSRPVVAATCASCATPEVRPPRRGG